MAEIEQVSLVNKLVRVVDAQEGIDNSGIVSFMYPNYLTKSEIFFDYQNDVIYTGNNKPGLRDELAHGTRNFIALVSKGMYDVDFTHRDVVINVLYTKWNKVPSDSVKNALDNMSEVEFWDFFKKFWVVGTSKIEKGASFFELYKVLGKQRFDILKMYFRMREFYEDSTIFSAVLGFVEKALNPEMVSTQSGTYLKMLNEFSKEYKAKIIPIIQRAYVMKCDTMADKEYRTLWTLMQFGKGNII